MSSRAEGAYWAYCKWVMYNIGCPIQTRGGMMIKVKPDIKDQAELLRRMQTLEGLLDDLRYTLGLNPDLPAWVLGEHKSVEDGRRAAMAIYAQIEFTEGQDSTKSATLPGIMAVDSEVLDIIGQINTTKDAIRKFCSALEGQYVIKEELDDPELIPPSYGKQMPYATYLFHRIGRARIHRVQLYRRITVLEQRPERLGFTWARTRRVKTRSRDEVINMLDRLGTSASEGDKAKIIGVPDERFAMVSDTQLNARANLVFKDEDGNERRQQKTLAMPMVYRQETDLPLPPCGKLSPDPVPNRYRLPRMRNKIEEQPFTKEIPVYRYLTT